MNSVRRLSAALAIAGACWGAIAAQQGAGAGFSTVHVAVTDADDRPVAGLLPEDFELLLDGAPQPIVHASLERPPLRVALVLDVTTRPAIPEAAMREIVDRLAGALAPVDRARVWRIGGGITAGAPFSGDRRVLLEAARPGIDPRDPQKSGPSPIWDGVLEATAALEEEDGRRAILLITDGRATGNRHGLGEAVERASVAGVAVSVLSPEATSMLQSEGKLVTVHPERMLLSLAANTGGRLFHYRESERPAAAALPDRILSGLRHEYALRIVRPAGDAARLIEVRVRRPGLILRARRIL